MKVNIEALDTISIVQDEVFESIFDVMQVDTIEADKLIAEYEARAKQLGVLTAWRNRLKAHKKEFKKMQKECRPVIESAITFSLATNDDGKIRNTIDNYLSILKHDEKFKDKIFYNEMSSKPEKKTDDGMLNWTDADDSEMRGYIELTYGIHSRPKLEDAFNQILKINTYNPLKQRIESIKWDGTSRIETFLIKWMKVEDTPYSREVSRLIFAGGIHRLYEPGCKFDEMVVLIGTKQGEGKSTIVNWLALEDKYFREVSTIEGDKGKEILQGAWICEWSELRALTRSRDAETAKSYISSRIDTYRTPYSRHPEDRPRRCIFIGTTNKLEFLTDKTGNRRYLPLQVHSEAKDLYNNKDKVMYDIEQCWAEALFKKDSELLNPTSKPEIQEMIKTRQDEAMEDDYRIGMIMKYIEIKEGRVLQGKEAPGNENYLCIIEIFEQALKNSYNKPTRKESDEIAQILNKLQGWKKGEGTKRFKNYGPQGFWERIEKRGEISDNNLPF